MPHPAQIDRDALIEAAHRLIEQHGSEQVSLRMVAEALGIRAPSLYHHVRSKDDLIRAVNALTLRRLFADLYAALATAEAAEAQMLAVCHAYRAFAQAQPITYALAYTALPAQQAPADEAAQAVLPLQAVMAHIAGEAHALVALRGALALLHGWVTLELAGQFRRGGDLDVAFAQAVATYLAGWRSA